MNEGKSNADRGAAPLKVTKNVAHGLHDIFVKIKNKALSQQMVDF